jgi:PadR family transcriptional regulator, regulatory protein PadR
MMKKDGRKKHEYRHLPAFILLILTKGSAHGGAVHNALSKMLPSYNPDTGAVYRTLLEMEQNGEVKFEWDTSSSGPARKVYHLTPTGWDKLGYWKKDIEQRLEYLSIFLKSYKSLPKKDITNSSSLRKTISRTRLKKIKKEN